MGKVPEKFPKNVSYSQELPPKAIIVCHNLSFLIPTRALEQLINITVI